MLVLYIATGILTLVMLIQWAFIIGALKVVAKQSHQITELAESVVVISESMGMLVSFNSIQTKRNKSA